MARVASRSSPTSEGLAPTALCVLVALVPLAFAGRLFEPYLTIKEALVQAGTVTIAAVWLITARPSPLALVLTPVWIPLIAPVLLGGLSLLRSSDSPVSLEAGQHLFFYFLLLAVALHQMRRTETRAALTTALVLAGTIEAVYVLLQYGLGDPIFVTDGLPGKWRAFGTLGNPNWTGEFLAVAALISLGRLVDLGPNEPRLFDIKPGVSKSSSGGKSQSAQRWMLLALILILLALDDQGTRDRSGNAIDEGWVNSHWEAASAGFAARASAYRFGSASSEASPGFEQMIIESEA